MSDPAEALETRRLFVNNFPYKTQNDDLRALFGACGEIASVKILTTPIGQSRGIGFVEFQTHEAAVEAIRRFHHTDYDGRVINVEFARLQRADDPDKALRPRRDFPPRGPPPPPRYPPEPAYGARYPQYQPPDPYYQPYPPPRPPGPAPGYYDWAPDPRDRWNGYANPRGY